MLAMAAWMLARIVPDRGALVLYAVPALAAAVVLWGFRVGRWLPRAVAVLAALYGVETRALTQAVKRNAERFPDSFMFQLSPREAANMRSQIVTASKRNIRYQPLAFTEHGVVMLSSVLNSPRSIQMSIMLWRPSFACGR